MILFLLTLQLSLFQEVTQIQGGLTNQTYLVKDDGKLFIARNGYKNAETLGIDRYSEFAAQTTASSLGISPKIRYWDPTNGDMIMDYIQGKPLTTDDLKKNENLVKTIDIIKKYHQIPYQSRFKVYTPYSVIEKYWTHIQNQRIQYPKELDLIVEEIKSMRSNDLVLSHHDLFHPNFLNENGKIWLIDWEYSGFNDRFADLASLCAENDFSEEDKKRVLELYFGDTLEMEQLEKMCTVFHVREMVWALVQKQLSQIEFDYDDYFNKHFKQCQLIQMK